VIFGDALHQLTLEGPALCVGVDPHPNTLERWGYPDSPAGLDGFLDVLLEQLIEAEALMVKPQVALFERHGVRGMTSLATLLGRLRQAAIPSIGDGKRGDIGSTMEGYASAWLSQGADFEVDALTGEPPNLGVGGPHPSLGACRRAEEGGYLCSRRRAIRRRPVCSRQ